MIPLKEDGSLDVERINELPIEEYMDVIRGLTEEQYEYYQSKTPLNEEYGPVKAVDFYPLEEVIERGIGVDADEIINKLRKVCEKRC